MKKSVICTECPLGCSVTVELSGESILSVTGNTCPRGRVYAESEVVRPKRILTTSLRTEDGRMIPVKTSCPIDRDALFTVMRAIKDIHPRTPIALGEVLARGVFEDADLIAASRLD